MRKFFSLIAVSLLLAIAVSAQTAGELQPDSERKQDEYAAHLKGYKVAGSGDKSITGARTKVKVKGDARLRASNVLRVGPSTTYLKHGLSIAEVVRFLGQPGSISERQEGDARLATYIFPRGERRFLVAEFKDGALIRSHVEVREELISN
jgi:hypothetical protein